MRELLRKVARKLRWPARLVGWGSDAYTIWSLKDIFKETVLSLWGLLALALSAIVSGSLGFWASTSSLSRIFVVIIAIGAFLLVFTLLVVVFRLAAARWARRKAEQQTEHNAAKQPAEQRHESATPHATPPATKAPQEARLPLEEHLKRFQRWRDEIESGDFARTPHGHSQFCTTETYVEMEPYLKRHVKHRMRSHAGAAVAWAGSPHLRGTEGDRRAMIGELARIQKEWGVQ